MVVSFTGCFSGAGKVNLSPEWSGIDLHGNSHPMVLSAKGVEYSQVPEP